MQNTALLLLVDDDVNNLKVLSGLLKREYQIKVATGGIEALRLAEGIPRPDLILLDIMMPEIDGYTVCKRLKSNPQTQDIPVIFLTAKTQPEDETQGFRAGAADYIIKPINPPVLWARVKAQLALAAQLKRTHQALDETSHDLTRMTHERDHIEIQRQQLQDQQQALLGIARAALLDLPLEKHLRIVLEALASVAWLEVEARGALFMTNRKSELIMVVQQGLSETQCHSCARISAESCIRTQAGPSLKPLFFPLTKIYPGNPLPPDATNTGCYALPLIEGNRVSGVLTLLSRSEMQPAKDTLQFMADVADIFTNFVRRRQTEEIMQISRLEVQMARNEIIHKLSVAAEFRDSETGFHVLRMSQYAQAIAHAMGYNEETCTLIELAAPMHDLGKIGIEDRILKKPGKLTREEFAAMQQHPIIGGRILEGDDPLIRMGREIALTHHEKWDGSGYPNGLCGEAIPFTGRVCAVADVFDALTTKRPYKEAWPVEKAIALIINEAGKAFDPKVVDAFQRVLPEIRTIKARYQDDTINPGDIITAPSAMTDANVWLPWNDSYSVGIDVIDEHHRYLLYWMNRAYKAVSESAGTVEIAKTLFSLEQYVQIHFKAEERLMAAYDYAELELHQRQHRAFEAEVHELREEIGHNPFVAGMKMVEYLRDWLFNHISKTDKQSFGQHSAPLHLESTHKATKHSPSNANQV